MKILYLILLEIVLYAIICIFFKKFKKDLIYIVAIGCAVNSNIFNFEAFPIIVGNLVLGVDSIIYTLFLFCVILMYFYHSEKDAMALTYTSIASILVGAIIQFVASCASYGFQREFGIILLSFAISAISSYIAVVVMLYVMNKMSKANKYLVCCIGILIASLINTVIYFSCTAIFHLVQNFVWSIIGSYILKIFCALFSILALYVIDKIMQNNIDNI